MGRTLPSFTQVILNEQSALTKFRRALRKQDQDAFDDLFRAARFHVAAAAYASHLLPFETMLLAMLIEEHKRVARLEILLERLLAQNPDLNLEPFMEQHTDADIERMDSGRLSPPDGDDGLGD